LNKNYIISTLVENKPGVLHKVSNMFRSRGFNIETISVAPTEKKDLSRMTITTSGDANTLEQIVKQLSKLIDIVKVNVLEPNSAIIDELALIKLHVTDTKSRSDLMIYANIFNAKVVDASSSSLIVEIVGQPNKIDAFLKLIASFRIEEISRTGLTALQRG
jgi:acetolactate synthase-1/3 small subunit